MISGNDDTRDTLLNIYMWYSGFNKMLLKLISPFLFPHLRWILKNFKSYMWLASGVSITFLSDAPHLNCEWWCVGAGGQWGLGQSRKSGKAQIGWWGRQSGTFGSSLLWLFSLISPVNKTLCLFFAPLVLSPAIPHLPPPSILCAGHSGNIGSLAADSELLIHPLPSQKCPSSRREHLGSRTWARSGFLDRVTFGSAVQCPCPPSGSHVFFLSLCYTPKRDAKKRIWVVI